MTKLLSVFAGTAILAGVVLIAPARAATSHYQEFGGAPGMSSMVNDFVNRVTSDPRIRAYFTHTNIPALKAALTNQFCNLEGGDCPFDMNMHTVHQSLGVTQAAFNALANDLTITMDNHHVPMDAQNNLLAKLAAMEPQVVTK
ncbi:MULTISPECIES: group I truncated hemoglobin [Acidiphilium]|uniref:group I truncated hemoglobin n=1 Tax=Acidiphilium TaxID=522 RepID=UPI000494C388|nr:MULTISPECIES: group 1 truncated hemoglobin [Acidiphilium]HQT84946.1 group 1 truncated hemoglobin [Acidiphilium rubrum]